MSWIVQNLWNNRTRIKHKSHPTMKELGDSAEFNTYSNRDLIYFLGGEESVDSRAIETEPSYDDPCIENDEFNDLLVVEKAIEELKELKLLSENDLDVLEREGGGNFNRGNPFRKTHSKHFYTICNRIAYYLGDYFTDEGYIDYISNKYKLDESHKETLRNYMKSKFRNKILTRSFKIGHNNEQTKDFPAEV